MSSPPQSESSFSRRLQLQDFMYKPNNEALSRRSPRKAVSATHATAFGADETVDPSPPRAVPSPRNDGTRTRSSSPVFLLPAVSTSTDPAGNRNKNRPKRKRKRRPSCTRYAPPSTYAHLPLLPDAVGADLLVLFVGLNPGLRTAQTGHAYSHPSNLFWKLLCSSGIVPVVCAPHEDRTLPRRFGLGLTNIVARPSRSGAELSRREMDAGVAVLEDKARAYRPETVCVVGKSIWESIWRVRHGGKSVGSSSSSSAFCYGWQQPSENLGVIDGEWRGARVFVASSTSGLAATLSPARKQEIWNELGVWVKKRREERKQAVEHEATDA